MICPICGKKLKNKDTFCSNCGFKVAKPPRIEERKSLLIPMLIGISVALFVSCLFLVVYLIWGKRGGIEGNDMSAKVGRESKETVDDSIFETEKLVLTSTYDEMIDGGIIYDNNSIRIALSGFIHDYSKASVQFTIQNNSKKNVLVKCTAYSINGRMKYKSNGEKFLECNVEAKNTEADDIDIGRQLGEQNIKSIENMDFLFSIYSDGQIIDTFQSSVITSQSDGDNDYIDYDTLFENDNILVQYDPEFDDYLFVYNKTDEHMVLDILNLNINGIDVDSQYIASATKYDIFGNTKAVIRATVTSFFYDENNIDYNKTLLYKVSYKLDSGYSEAIDLDMIISTQEISELVDGISSDTDTLNSMQGDIQDYDGVYKNIDKLIGSDSNFDIYLEKIKNGHLVIRWENKSDIDYNVDVDRLTICGDNYTSMTYDICFAHKSISIEMDEDWLFLRTGDEELHFGEPIPTYSEGEVSGRVGYYGDDRGVNYINVNGEF